MKITPKDLDDMIESIDYIQPKNTTVTICLLGLKSGFYVIGKSACINPADFYVDIGRKIAFENAKEQLWELEGYHRMRSNG